MRLSTPGPRWHRSGFWRVLAVGALLWAAALAAGGTAVQAQAPAAVLTLAKTGPGTTQQMGSTVHYEITVGNGGTVPLTNVTVRDDMLGLLATVPLLGPGSSAAFAGDHILSEADVPPDMDPAATHFALTNTAYADADQTGPVTASWSTDVEYWFNAARAALDLQMACPASAAVGERVEVRLLVRNIGDVPLANVRLASAPLGLDASLASLAVAAADERTATYTLQAADAPGPLVLEAAAWSDLAQRVSARCEVAVAPAAPACERSDVTVILAGAGPGSVVRAWVGGTEQPALTAAPNARGEPQASWTFYPPAGARWQVRVAADLPVGLDPARWAFVPEGDSTVTLGRCEQRTVVLRLVDQAEAAAPAAGAAAAAAGAGAAGAGPVLPQAAGVQPVPVLPQVGAWEPVPAGLRWGALPRILGAWLAARARFLAR